MPAPFDTRLALPRPLRAGIASLLASVVDLATLLLIAQTAHVAAGLAVALGCLAGGAVNFALSRRWVFRTRGAGRRRQFALYGFVIVGGGAVLAGLLVQLATTTLGAPLLPARCAIAVVLFVCWNYPLSSLVVFAKEPVR